MTQYSCEGCRGTAGPAGCPTHGGNGPAYPGSRSVGDHQKAALDAALGALTAYYNGVIAEKDQEIARLKQEVERLAALAKSRLHAEKIN